MDVSKTTCLRYPVSRATLMRHRELCTLPVKVVYFQHRINSVANTHLQSSCSDVGMAWIPTVHCSGVGLSMQAIFLAQCTAAVV